ncbi:MAG: hypothetical protein K8M05_10730 [Deltaproteobacteria bacterium]|nr:hypothetical protein [Kofleriaceae bacterium]
MSDGSVCHAIGAALTALALVLYALDDPRAFRLVLMWCFGFLLIITPEGLSDATIISHIYGPAAYDIASRCIVASHLAVLLGHDLTFREQDVAPASGPWLMSVRVATPLLLLGWLMTVLYVMPSILVAYSGGRAALEVRTTSALTAIAEGLALTTRIVVPIVAVWIAKRARGLTRTLMLVMAASVLLLAIVAGVRFVLLFSVVGAAIAWMVPRPPSRRTFAALLGVALALAVTSRVLSESRTFGIQNASVSDIIQETSPADFVVMSEKSVRSMAQAVVFTNRHGFTDGRSSAAVLVFWIPRALWPDKPTLIGYWLPREFGRVDAGFSAAPAFTGSTFVDFGLWGSVLAWFFGGLLFGLLERFVARICANENDARVLLVAPLYGGTFFAVRSPDTSVLILVGVIVSTLIVLVFAGYRRIASRGSSGGAGLP